ncbi:DUF1016 domain-containing protein [Rathayibacter tritici]|uniref:DUF1016 domain-containing protein n=1 Tax=Rathayibacter tritici TaxID=33888 RepID=UPI0011B0C9EF|nr:DUF1016 domain-containing protein [Rathayibacter tritici]
MQLRAQRTVHTQLISYWDLGHAILEQQAKEPWGPTFLIDSLTTCAVSLRR